MRRVQQVLFSLLAMISLATGTLSACTCPHHHETGVEVESCHDHSDGHGAKRVSAANRFSDRSDCVCADTGSRTLAKAERPQIDQQTATLASPIAEGIEVVGIVTLSPRPVFERPFYLTDSFHDLSPKRGPPVL